MTVLHYPTHVSFLAGLTVAQVSEFSLILAALGLSLGHITNATVSLITVVGLITIGGSTYLIMYSHQIYRRLHRWLTVFERPDDIPDVDVILYGLGRFGSRLVDGLTRAGHHVLAIDFDPHRIAVVNRDGGTAVFGSAEDIHFLEHLPLARTRAIVSTIPIRETNQTLLRNLRHHHYTGLIVVTAHSDHDAARLHDAGADTILEPFAAAATTIAAALHHQLSADPHKDPDTPHDGTE